MKKGIITIVLLMVSFIVNAQLSNDQKIQMLQTANQSTAVIEAAMGNNFSIEEIDQANKLKKEGIKDEIIIYVLESRIKLTDEDIATIKDYQAKKYSDSIIKKSLEDKPKFNTPNEQVKDNKNGKQVDKSTSSEFRRFDLQIIINTQITSVSGDFKIPVSYNPTTNMQTYSPMVKQTTLGFAAGVSSGFHFTKNTGISLGFFYSSQGQNFLTSNVNYTDGSSIYPYGFSRYVTLSYLKIPLQFHFNTNPDKPVSFSSYAGCYFGFLVNYYDYIYINDKTDPAGNETMTATGKIFTDKYDNINHNYVLTSPVYNSFDFGVTSGAGISIRLSSKLSIPIILNYQRGLTDVKNYVSQYNDAGFNYRYWQYWSGDATDPNYKIAYHNYCFGLMTGLKINL